MHATRFLKEINELEIPPVVLLQGGERALKSALIDAVCERVLGSDTMDVFRFPGPETEFKTIRDELFMMSMWSDRKVVVVDDADAFVSAHRARLETYCEKPASKGVLILDTTSEKKNTRLAKRVIQADGFVECTPLKGSDLIRWLRETAKDEFGKQLSFDAARQLVELAGDQLGLLLQELSKLASYTGDRSSIDVGTVRTLVGGWKAETTWAMLAALRDGNTGKALADLAKLTNAGEPPLKTLGGISFVFRKYAHATEYARAGMALGAALSQAGVFSNEVGGAERYLRRIGRPKAEQVYRRLLDAELGLKGDSRLPEPVQLEQLLVHLSGKS